MVISVDRKVLLAVIHDNQIAEATQPFCVDHGTGRNGLNRRPLRGTKDDPAPDTTIRATDPEAALHLPAHRRRQPLAQPTPAAHQRTRIVMRGLRGARNRSLGLGGGLFDLLP